MKIRGTKFSFNKFKTCCLKSAFTMAEAILVMTILGIIATIMISTLKPAKFRDESLEILAKKVLSEIDNATTQILINDSIDGTFDNLVDKETGEVFGPDPFSGTTAHNTVKLIGLYKKYLSTIRKESTHSFCVRNPDLCITLKDGALLSFNFFAISDLRKTKFPGEAKSTMVNATHGIIQFDVNGYENPPNSLGKDLFEIPLGKYGIEY